jgi:glycosyltransferase involved in cell wall biosynthesis
LSHETGVAGRFAGSLDAKSDRDDSSQIVRIVIDARMLYWTGVALYTLELLKNLEQLDRENEYLVLVRPEDWDKWKPSAGNFRKVEAAINPYTFAEQLQLPGLIRGLKPDLVHFTASNTPLLYGGRRVVTVHDLTLLDFDTARGSGLGKSLRGLKRLPFRVVLWNNARGASVIITVTDYVRQQMVKRWSMPVKRLRVTYEAIDPEWDKPEPIGKYQVGDDYLFYVGTYYPYKNVGSSVDAFAQVAPKFPKLQLVLAGQGDYFRTELMQRVKMLGLSSRVKFLGRVTDGEKMTLYRGARAYLNPSLSEGFGLQGLEAMATGVPVLAAKASCLPEVYGNAALYFDPQDSKDQASAMERVLSDKELHAKLVKAGHERLKHFSWKTTAEQTLEVYRRVGEQAAAK